MSDPSYSDTVNGVSNNLKKSTNIERDWWNRSGTEARNNILKRVEDIGTHYETASENAYQLDYTAKLNQLVKTKYDSLPRSVKSVINETLTVMGELPNPSDFKGVGHLFEAEGSLDREVFVECDRCDQEFMSNEDFDFHKKIDHGDDNEEFEESEEQYTLSMDPDLTREALREARKVLAETKEEDLHRSVYFNGKDLPQPTGGEPDDVKGTKGYNDNPNAGLYDNKLFTTGNSRQRNAIEAQMHFSDDGVDWASEIRKWEQFKIDVMAGDRKGIVDAVDKAGGDSIYFSDPETPNSYVLEQIDEEIKEMRGWEAQNAEKGYNDMYYSTNQQYPTGESRKIKANEVDQQEVSEYLDELRESGETNMFGAGAYVEREFGISREEAKTFVLYWMENFGKENYVTEGDLEMVPLPDEATDKPIDTLKDVDFSEDAVEFVYPTKRVKSTEAEESEDFLEGYDEKDMESENDAVEAQIIDRKMNGYSLETIARELVIQYGVEHPVAYEKASSVEVSINDKVANTFFGKRYSECNESELRELRSYTGTDGQ
jgi:hypothetical protein